MQVQATEFPGLFIIEPRVFEDSRGFFLESWNQERFETAGIRVDWVQDNHSKSVGSGVLRGFHYQAPPTAQAKLVWVTRGAVVDVVVDLRVGSPMYGKWGQLKLSERNFLRIFIPKGFAHAYMTLSDETEFMYKVDAPYSPGDEGGIRWDDPDLNVNWPVAEPLLSDKDKHLPLLRDLKSPFTYGGP